MSQILLNMAQQATKDPTLMAGLIDQYTKQTGSSWAEVADDLQISAAQLARLALCRHPNGNARQEIQQIADYVKMSPVVLNHFYDRAKNGEPLTSNKTVYSRKTAGETKQKSTKQGRNFSVGRGFMSKRYVWAAGIVVVLLLIASVFVMAQTTAVSEATLVVNDGEVMVTQAGKTVTAVSGDALVVMEGDTVTTGDSATAQLHLADGGTVDLFASTTVEITELVTTDDKYQVTLTMLAGRTLNRVVHLLGIEDHYEVRSPSSTASVRGTVFTVDVLSQESTYVGVDEGVVNVTMGDQSVDVAAGFEVTAVVGELLIVTPQGQDEPAAEPTTAPTPTEVPPTPEPTQEPEPTAAPVTTEPTAKSEGKSHLEENTTGIPFETPPDIGGKVPPVEPDGSTPDDDDSDNPAADPEKENGGNPHEGMTVPGNTPGDGQTPEGGAEIPGQGGTPPGQTDNPSNNDDNNAGGNNDNNGNSGGNSGNNNGNGGGKKD